MPVRQSSGSLRTGRAVAIGWMISDLLGATTAAGNPGVALGTPQRGMFCMAGRQRPQLRRGAGLLHNFFARSGPDCCDSGRGCRFRARSGGG